MARKGENLQSVLKAVSNTLLVAVPACAVALGFNPWLAIGLGVLLFALHLIGFVDGYLEGVTAAQK